jgi:hypothetical protein
VFRGDASSEIQRLERELRDAEERFLHAPGGLWLAASATLEALSRIDPALLDEGLRARAARLTEQAQRTRREGDSRASQHELAALTEWVELARHRAALEEAFLAARLLAPRLFTSRAELAQAVEADERALEKLSRDAVGALASTTEALVTRLRSTYPEYDPHGLPEELVDARGRAALRELSGELSGSGPRGRAPAQVTWSVRPFPSSELLVAGAALSLALATASFAYFGSLTRLAAIGSVGASLLLSAALLGAALLRRRAEMGRRVAVLEAWGFRERTARARELAQQKHERWVTIARTLGQLDAFRRTEQGVALEVREQRLPALAPWVRTLVGGLDESEARRFAAE